MFCCNIIFWSCMIVTTLSCERWWFKYEKKLDDRMIKQLLNSIFAMICLANQLFVQPSGTENSWSARHWQITIFYSTSCITWLQQLHLHMRCWIHWKGLESVTEVLASLFWIPCFASPRNKCRIYYKFKSLNIKVYVTDIVFYLLDGIYMRLWYGNR